MDFLTLILLAFGLAADAFAVSVTNGIYCKQVSKKNVLLNGVIFGVLQAVMPVFGFFLGQTFTEIVHRYQHWAALFLLGFIGINMLSDAIKDLKEPEVSKLDTNIFTLKNLIMQGIATSIDAFAAGVSFAVLQMNIFLAAFIIGIVTMICCCIGVSIGKLFGVLLGLKAKLVGGIVLLLIGMKIFLENYI